MKLKSALLCMTLFALAVPAEAATCEGLAQLSLPGATITTAQSVPAGKFTPPDGHALGNLPAFCRVAGVIKPSSDSDIQFEVWMPSSGWNGKFRASETAASPGPSGIAAMGAAIHRGYATASTDTGHQAMGRMRPGPWGTARRSIDYGYRAVHETAAKAKAIIQAFYGDGPAAPISLPARMAAARP